MDGVLVVFVQVGLQERHGEAGGKRAQTGAQRRTVPVQLRLDELPANTDTEQ